MFSRDVGAGTALLGLLVATGLFTVAFVTVVQVSFKPQQDLPQTSQSSNSAVAANVADSIIQYPGKAWYSVTAPCLSGTRNIDTAKFQPDSMTQFGLAEERCAIQGDARSSQFNLSYDKLQNLYGAKLTSTSGNAAVDYQDARKSLALDQSVLDFHIRSYPVLPGVQRILATGYKDPYLRPLYIGDYLTSGGGGGTKAVQHTTSVTDSTGNATVNVAITNNGTMATIFGVYFKVELKSGNIDLTLATPLLNPSESYTVSWTIRKTADWKWNDDLKKWVTYKISDKDGDFHTGTISLSSITMTHAETRHIIVTESDKLYFVLSGGSVETSMHYASYDGEGKEQNENDWTLKLLNPSWVDVYTWVLPSEKKGEKKYTLTSAGTYRANVSRASDITYVYNSDRINVVSSAPSAFTSGGSYTYSPGASVVPEATYIDYLIQYFDLNVYGNTYNHASLAYAAGGDVYPDVKSVLNDDVTAQLTNSAGAATTSKVNILFVGTNVDHNAMTSQAAKGTIRDWVFAGGTLVVFGSDDQSVSWLQPLFHSAISSGSGGISVPDENHPILITPNDLDPLAYDPHGTAWDFSRDQDRNSFTHVVPQDDDDILAVSNPGAYGEGRILLTSWQPYDLTYGTPPADCAPATLQPTCAGLLLIDNFVTLSYRGLYLDYGPPIPTDVAQGVQSRIAVVWHPEMKKHVELYVVVYVFG